VVRTTASRRNQASVAAPVIVTKVATPAISAAEALQSLNLSRISSAATAPGTLQCHPSISSRYQRRRCNCFSVCYSVIHRRSPEKLLLSLQLQQFKS